MALNRIGKSYDYRAICDVCGFKKWSYELRKRWDGLMVCQEDWEPRNILDFYRTRNDAHRLPFTRPDAQEVTTELTVSGYALNFSTYLSSGISSTGAFLNPVASFPLTIEYMIYFNKYPSEVGIQPTIYTQAGLSSLFIDSVMNSPQFVFYDSVSTNTISFYTSTSNMNLNVILPRNTWGRLSWVCQSSTSGTMYLTYKNTNGNIVQISQICSIFTGASSVPPPAVVSVGFCSNLMLDDIRWWNTVRTAQQIANTWNSVVPANLLNSNYRFDEGFSGNLPPTKLYDSCFATDSTRALVVVPAIQFAPHMMQYSNSGV